MFKGIIRINKKCVPACDVGLTFDLGNNGCVWSECIRGGYFTGKPASDNTLDNIRLIQSDFLPVIMQCHPGAYTGPGWTAIELSFGKNTNVAALAVFIFRRADEDRTV